MCVYIYIYTCILFYWTLVFICNNCNVVTQFGDELYQCKDPDVRARGQRVKVLELVNLEINNVSINS